MHAELKWIHLIPDDPVDPDSAWYEMGVGFSGLPGSQIFTIHVCTPGWVARQLESHDVVYPIHMLLVDGPRSFKVENILRSRVESFHGPDIDAVLALLERFALSEFDSYRPAPN